MGDHYVITTIFNSINLCLSISPKTKSFLHKDELGANRFHRALLVTLKSGKMPQKNVLGIKLNSIL